MILIFLKDILEFIYNLLLQFGINSRSIRLFLRDDLYLSGRENIYNDVLSQISKKPFYGIGLAGDRRVLGGVYAHNIIFELLANFGIITGIIISILIVGVSLKSIFSKNKSLANFISIWFSIGFIHLMVSSSYLIDFKFWIFLGLALKGLTKTNRH